MGAQMSLVASNLYLGSWQGANNAKLLEENNVHRILTIFDAKFSMPECVRRRNHLHLVAADSCQQDIRQFFSQSNDFVHSGRVTGEGVFVHCMAGISRSATLIVVYLASVTDLPWDTVLKAVRAAKHDVAPNFHFRAQMRLWQTDGGLEAERARLAEKFGAWDFQAEDKRHLLQLANVCDEFERTGYWRGEPNLVRRGNAYFAVHHLPDADADAENGDDGKQDEEDDEDGEVENAEEAVEQQQPSVPGSTEQRWAERTSSNLSASSLDHRIGAVVVEAVDGDSTAATMPSEVDASDSTAVVAATSSLTLVASSADNAAEMASSGVEAPECQP